MASAPITLALVSGGGVPSWSRPRPTCPGRNAGPTVLDPSRLWHAARTAQSQFLTPELLAELLCPALADASSRDRAVAVVDEFGQQGYLTLRSLLD
jgi:hypothetical protein